MQKITNASQLRAVIVQLEHKENGEWALLKAQLFDTCESLKPINIIQRACKEAVSAPGLKTNIINAAIGTATGFIAKRAILGKTHNPFAKLLGVIIEMVVATKVVKHADEIKSFGSIIIKKMTDQQADPEKI